MKAVLIGILILTVAVMVCACMAPDETTAITHPAVENSTETSAEGNTVSGKYIMFSLPDGTVLSGQAQYCRWGNQYSITLDGTNYLVHESAVAVISPAT